MAVFRAYQHFVFLIMLDTKPQKIQNMIFKQVRRRIIYM